MDRRQTRTDDRWHSVPKARPIVRSAKNQPLVIIHWVAQKRGHCLTVSMQCINQFAWWLTHSNAEQICCCYKFKMAQPSNKIINLVYSLLNQTRFLHLIVHLCKATALFCRIFGTPCCVVLNMSHTIILLLFWNLSGTIRVSRYQKGKNQEGKINLDLLEQETVNDSGISWTIGKSAPRPDR